MENDPTAFGLTHDDISRLAQPENNARFMNLLYKAQGWANKLVYVLPQDAEDFGDRGHFILGLLGAAFALGRLQGREDSTVTFVVREEE